MGESFGVAIGAGLIILVSFLFSTLFVFIELKKQGVYKNPFFWIISLLIMVACGALFFSLLAYYLDFVPPRPSNWPLNLDWEITVFILAFLLGTTPVYSFVLTQKLLAIRQRFKRSKN